MEGVAPENETFDAPVASEGNRDSERPEHPESPLRDASDGRPRILAKAGAVVGRFTRGPLQARPDPVASLGVS